MSDLIELLSDLGHLESTKSELDRTYTEQHAMSLIFDMREQLEDLCADHTMSANSAVASVQNDEYSTASTSKICTTHSGHD